MELSIDTMAGPPQPKSVIIIGGSLAGLMHALTLLSLPNPPTVRILERSPTNLLHNQGAGIVSGPDTQHFFEKYVRPGRGTVVSSTLRHYLDRTGMVIPQTIDRRSQDMTSWDLTYYLLRWRVEGLESSYVEGLEADDRPKAQYENGCTVTNVEDAGDQGVKVTWMQKDRGEQTAFSDMVLAADGPSSTVRRLLEPSVERTYAGYVAWRGTVPESDLSEAAADVFVDNFTFFHSNNIQSLCYGIPGPNGALEKGKRLYNWVWYCNHPQGSKELDELMTDINGRRHAITLPVGAMQPHVWEKQKAYASQVLPPQFAEAVHKTQQPFIQAITDVLSSWNSYMDDKVLLVGDAVAGFRPHTAASTSQAAFDATMLGEFMMGKIGREEYNVRVMEYADTLQKHGVMLGDRSQFGRHPFSR